MPDELDFNRYGTIQEVHKFAARLPEELRQKFYHTVSDIFGLGEMLGWRFPSGHERKPELRRYFERYLIEQKIKKT